MATESILIVSSRKMTRWSLLVRHSSVLVKQAILALARFMSVVFPDLA